jgi:hypothetical protein
MISDLHYNDIDWDLQRERLLIYETPKGHIMNTSITFYLKKVIRPYSESIRAEIGDSEALIFSVMDDPRDHNRPEHIQLMKELNMCRTSLSRHPTHFLQSLDVGVFGPCEAIHRNHQSQGKETKPKIKGKIHYQLI